MTEQDLVILKKLTKITDIQTLHILTMIVRNSIESVVTLLHIDPTKPIKDNTNFFMTLAEEIGREIRAGGMVNYSVVVGKDLETVIRHDKDSLASYKWNQVRITLFQCPPNPIHPLEEASELTPHNIDSISKLYSSYYYCRKNEMLKDMNIIREYIKETFTFITLEKLKDLMAEMISTYLTNDPVINYL